MFHLISAWPKNKYIYIEIPLKPFQIDAVRNSIVYIYILLEPQRPPCSFHAAWNLSHRLLQNAEALQPKRPELGTGSAILHQNRWYQLSFLLSLSLDIYIYNIYIYLFIYLCLCSTLLNWQHKSPRHSTTQCWYEVLSKGSICAGTSTNTRSSSN